MSYKNAKTAVQNAKQLADVIPNEAPVVVVLVNDQRVKEEWRGITLFGFWLGVSPNPKISPAVRSPLEGRHWIAHVLDARSDSLLYDLHLNIIDKIDVSRSQVERERER